MLEEDDNDTREAVVWLRDLFQCDMKPHAQQVNYLENVDLYILWNSHLSSQCASKVKKKKHGRISPFKKMPPCNDTSLVSDVCRHSALHVAKVSHLHVLPRLSNIKVKAALDGMKKSTK